MGRCLRFYEPSPSYGPSPSYEERWVKEGGAGWRVLGENRRGWVRILGLDLGRKRIGVAVSDPMAIVAQGVKSIIVQDEARAIDEICAFIKENEVEEVVVGLPLNMDGSEGQMAKEAALFAEKLKARTGAPIKMWDERLTSLQIEKDLVFMDVSRAKRKKINDMLAAQIILQNYLDSREK